MAEEKKGTQGSENAQESQETKESAPETLINAELLGKTINVANTLAEKMNTMSGGEGKVELHFIDFFRNVFVKHTRDEADEIFICGTAKTTPAPEDISSEWPKPWLYSRVGFVMILTYWLLYLCVVSLNSLYALAGLIVIGAFVVPVTLLIFFFEVNVPRNISFASLLAAFFVGGTSSLFVTLILFQFFPTGGLGFLRAAMIGLIEETGKLIIVAIYIRRKKNCNYILNAMLYGAAVGAGFDAFESAGYGLVYGLMEAGSIGTVLSITNARALTAPGGHIVWAAITGAAIMIVKKDRELTLDIFREKAFWMIYIWPIAMHAAWDMPININIGPFSLHHIILIVVAWIMIVVLLNRGLAEINSMHGPIEAEIKAPEKKKKRTKKAAEGA